MSREHLDDLIARFLEDTLTPAERAELLAEVKAFEASARLFRDALETNALLNAAARNDAAFFKGVMASIRTDGDANAKQFSGDTIIRLRKSSPKGLAVFAAPARFSAHLKWIASATALIAIAVSAYLHLRPVPSPDAADFSRATVRAVSGIVDMSHNGAPVTARVGMKIDIGDSFHTGANGAANADFSDSSKISLGANTALAFVARTGTPQNKNLRLDAGALTVQAAHQPGDRPMIVATPHAIATVAGTRFVLKVDGQSTALDVTEGRVRFEILADHSTVEVSAREHAATPVAAPPSVPVQASRNLALWPFSPRSPWNMPIGGNAQYAPIASAVFDSSKGARVTCREFSHPVFLAANTDPLRKIFVLQNAEPYATLRVPDAMQPNPRHFIHCLIDPVAERFHEFSDLKRLPNGDLNAHEAYGNDLNGDGFPGPNGSARISGASGIGGLIRAGELKNGIPHAVALAITKGALGYTPGGQTFVWPANTGSLKFSDAPSNLHFGTLIVIPKDVKLETLGVGSSGEAFEIAKALQDYGGYAVESFGDNQNAMAVFVEPGAENEVPPDLETQLSKLIASLQTLSNNTPETPGGGGVLRRTLAPPTLRGRKDEF